MFNILANASSIYDADNIAATGHVSVSWLGILVAVITAMIIGTLWYGPLFGNRWMKIVKLKRGESSPVGPMLAMIALALIQAFILAHFISYVSDFYYTYSGVSVGLLTAMWAYLGFVVPVLVSNTVFSKGSVDLLKINLGNQLVTLLAIGAILGAFS